MYYHQRSRVNWLNYGDRNTAFFHATMIQRRQRNQLIKLKNGNGDWLTEEEDINFHLKDYFHSLFLSNESRNMENALSVVGNSISPVMNLDLTREFSVDEIELAAFQLGALKAPGPDGYPGFFYQTYWETVKNDVIRAVKSFHSSGFLLK